VLIGLRQTWITTRLMPVIIDGMKNLPGRKAMIFFSEGITLPTNVMSHFRSVISNANRANVSIYAVDAAGLDAMDRRYLVMIAENYNGGPVGIETIAAALSEPRDAIEEIIEPFLIQKGFIQRTPRGRLLTGHAFRHLGLAEPTRDPAQFGLFGKEQEEE